VASEGPKVAQLLEKYDIASNPVNLVNSVNSEGESEAPADGPELLFI
jgi:hypothetical protein